jgi:hypothetical protein
MLLFHSAEPAKGSGKVGLNRRIGRRRHRLASHDHDVQPSDRRADAERRLPAKHLANPTLGAIAHDGPADPARRDDAKPIALEGIWSRHEREKTGRDPPAAALHPIELTASAQSSRATKLRRHSADTASPADR